MKFHIHIEIILILTTNKLYMLLVIVWNPNFAEDALSIGL